MEKKRMSEKVISILYPHLEGVQYKQLSETTCHDLGFDVICQKLTDKEDEQRLIMSVLSRLTAEPRIAQFRQEVFADILSLPDMRQHMLELLDKVQFLKDYGSFKRDYDKKAGLWDLLHRLDEINDYIQSVEAIKECLSVAEIQSEGLKNLRAYVEDIYQEAYFAEMKQDIANLKADTSNLKSITVGINLNERFEAEGVGLISVNNKPFKHSNIVSNFSEAMSSRRGVKEGTDWNGDFHYHPIDKTSLDVLNPMQNLAGVSAVSTTSFVDARIRNSVAQTIVNIPQQEGSDGVTYYMDKVISQLLSVTVKKLRDVLSKYVMVTINSITDLIPEFVYYIRFAEYIEKMMKGGKKFCKATVLGHDTGADVLMQARGIYNLRLATAELEDGDEIITNDLDFDQDHMVYILTGANRGGKTTITQAIGILYVMAQGGIYVPGDSFSFVPVDMIYTHYPADEDKTMDLGRLGEECQRFKNMYSGCTDKSLLLLNETFSTTSFEEGYYIARDAVKAILSKGVRTIYNTHMHKLAYDIDNLNDEGYPSKAVSLVAKSDGGNRSFKVEIAPPEGLSYAKDIAEKYGVTYDMLVQSEG
jgi:hypothetical protein